MPLSVKLAEKISIQATMAKRTTEKTFLGKSFNSFIYPYFHAIWGLIFLSKIYFDWNQKYLSDFCRKDPRQECDERDDPSGLFLVGRWGEAFLTVVQLP